MGEGGTLRLEHVPIVALTLNARNPKLHPAGQIKQLAKSIETFGFIVPVIVSRDFDVIAGHGRIFAAKQLGRTEVPCIRIDHLTEAQAKAFMIADNRLTELAEWDERLLAENLKELSLLELDFDLEVIGFESGEIDLMIEGLSEPVRDEDLADAALTVPPAPPVTRPGDLWSLGNHRLLCADATDGTSLVRLMDGSRAGMVFVDPPFNVPIPGNVSGLGRIEHRNFAMASGEMSEQEFTAFLEAQFKLLAAHSCAGSVHFVCMDWRHCLEILTAAKKTYRFLNLCVWNKTNGGMGSLYRSKHELIFVFKNGSAPHQNNIELGVHGRNRTNVWDYPGANSFHEGRLDDLAAHPTIKPVALVAEAILDCSKRNSIVLDTFAGSGTTIVAAERTGRRAYAMEIDPIYVDVAIQRFEKLTGKTVVHAETKQSLAEMKAERLGELGSGGGAQDGE